MSRRAVLAALAAGLVASVAVTGEPIGLGVALCALALGVAGRLGRSGPLDPWSRVWAALAAGLAATAVLRAAGWVVVPSLFAALALASLALAGGATWAAIASGLTRVAARLGPGTAALTGAIGRALPGGGTAAPALRGAALAVALLTVFGVLFASGDAAFAHLADAALPDVSTFAALRDRALWFVAGAALAAALATVGLRSNAAPASATPAASPSQNLGVIEWGIALVALNVLFAAFVAVQAAVLFGKHEHVLSTAGLTYAEYAREGFVQLLVAAALTLAVLAGALRWARAEARWERILLRALLVLLCVSTLVILASAAHRLDLYQDAFGATRARLAASVSIVWIAALLALVLAATAASRFRWLPRACVLATAVTMLGFSLYDPDRRIAERNVERYQETRKIDLRYLSGLSADAVPALTELPPSLSEQTLHQDLEDSAGWGGYNLARERARDAMAEAMP